MDPYLLSAKNWLEMEYLGHEDFLSDFDNEIALRIVVARAFVEAIPALDLTLTPTGFAVISTDNLAPASKERVERLIASLRISIDENIEALFEACRKYPQWRESERGRYFCSSFLFSPKAVKHFRPEIRPTFSWIYENAVLVEKKLEMDYLGKPLMDRLRTQFVSNDNYNPVAVNTIIAAIFSVLESKLTHIPPRYSLWYYARNIIHECNHDDELAPLWQKEMGDKSVQFGGINNIKGCFFF